MEKKCATCQKVKQENCFGNYKKSKDGKRFECKECRSAREKNRYYNEKEHIKEVQKKYTDKNKEKIFANWKRWYEENKEIILNKIKNYENTPRGKEVRRKADDRQHKKYPERRNARAAVSNAVYAGRLPKIHTMVCSVCNNKQAEHYHHHKGYDREYWLDVIPVCAACHKKID